MSFFSFPSSFSIAGLVVMGGILFTPAPLTVAYNTPVPFILTSTGSVPIDHLSPGEPVIGYDFAGGAQIEQMVEKIVYISDATEYIVINNAYELYVDQSLYVKNGAAPGADVTTDTHASTRVIHASELSPGDTIYTHDGMPIVVNTLERVTRDYGWHKLIISGNHSYIRDGIIVHNASRYWVGGGSSANWSATGNTNWGSASNTRDNASVPNTSDTVFFDGVGNGAADSTISASITVNSLNMTGYTNTLTHNSSVTLTISGNTFTLASGMTYTKGNASTSAVSFTSTSGTSGTPTAITTAGQTLGNVTINGSGGYFSLSDHLTMSDSAILTITNGTFTANDKNVTTGRFASTNSNTRAVIMGNGTWTLIGSGTTLWNTVTVTNLTFTRGNAVVATTSASSGTRTFTMGALGESSAPSLSIVSGSDTVLISNGSQVYNLDFTGFTGTLNGNTRTVYGNLTFASGMTLSTGSATTMAATSGTKTITTNGAIIQIPITINGSGGTFSLADNITVLNSNSVVFTVTAGTLHIPQTMTLQAPELLNNGTITVASGVTWTLNASTTNHGTITHSGNGWVMGQHFVNTSTGSVTYSGTAITAKANFEQYGTFDLTGKTLTFSGQDSMVKCSGTLGGTVVISITNGSFLNGSGCTIALSAAPSTLVGTNFTNLGTVQIPSGSWSVDFLSSTSTLPHATRSSMGLTITGDTLWRRGVRANNGKIYGIPNEADQILIIDTNTGTASLSNMGVALPVTAQEQWNGGVLANDGKIYCIPEDATSILIIDPSNDTATLSAMGADLSGSFKWRGGVLANNGKIYGIPDNATDILIIDPSAGTATRSAMGADLTGNFKWNDGVLANNGKIYGIPTIATDILIIDPEAGTATRSSMGATLTDTEKWSSGVLADNGKIYGVPRHAKDVLIIDPDAGTATRSNMGEDMLGTYKWRGGILGPDDKIYAMPDNATDILIIDPATNTATRSSFGADLSGLFKWRGSVMGSDNKIYSMPDDANDILILDFNNGPQFINEGTVTHSGSGLTLDAHFENTGTFTAPSGTMSLAGNFANSGTFTHNSRTVNLNGTSQRITGTTTFYNLQKSVSSADTLTFAPATTQTIAGTLTLAGTSGNLLTLVSSTTGSQWKIDPQGTRSLSYLSVKDSNNTNATAIDATSGTITDAGNNTNWTFTSSGSGGGSGSNSSTSLGGVVLGNDPLSVAVSPFPRTSSIAITPSTTTLSVPSQASSTDTHTLAASLAGFPLGCEHPSVLSLQIFLNKNGFSVASSGPGSPGNETMYYGPRTKQALTAYIKRFESVIRTPAPAVFLCDLAFGSLAGDVKNLQKFLNSHGHLVATNGYGSPGQETSFFGSATRNAVISFQKKYGVTPPIGFFGTTTRSLVNALVK